MTIGAIEDALGPVSYFDLASFSEASHEPRPVGSVGFTLGNFPFSEIPEDVVILEWAAGLHCFVFLVSKNGELVFAHGSPGSGTRAVSVPLTNRPNNTESMRLYASWHPLQITFAVGWHDKDGNELSYTPGKQVITNTLLLKGSDGNVMSLTGDGARIAYFSIELDGKPFVRMPATMQWGRALEAVNSLVAEPLLQASAEPTMLCNAAIRTLVSAFEVYVKTRLEELVGEGYPFDYERIARKIFRPTEIAAGIHLEFYAEAAGQGRNVIEHLFSKRRVAIQSYEEAKSFFKKGFKLDLSGSSMGSVDVDAITVAVKHRHRLTHYDPVGPQVQQSPLIICDDSFVGQSVISFDKVIQSIHRATLTLSPD